MKLPNGTNVHIISLWNRDQWKYMRYPHNWFSYKNERVWRVLTVFGFSVFLCPEHSTEF